MAADDLPPLTPDPDVLCTHVRELRWRFRAVDEWRREVDGRVSVLESEVVTEKSARELRAALEATLGQRATARWTRSQVVIAGIVGAIAVADLLRGLVS